MYIQRLSLPLFANNEIEDFNYFKHLYDGLAFTNDKRINKIKKKKEILSSTFDTLTGLFDLKYDLKLKFDSLEDSEDTIYLSNIDNITYNQAFSILFDKCFKRYLSNMYMYKVRITDEMYNVVSLALLNDHDKVINDLTSVIYDELINNGLFEKSFTRERKDIEYSDLKELLVRNEERNKKLKEKIMSYEISDDLSYHQLNNIYACFSNNVFNTLHKEEVVHLMNLLYNYHTYTELYNFMDDYKENMTNKDALCCILNKLILPGRTMIVKRKNMDLIKDALSGISIIYKNEVEKKYVNTLDDLKNIENINKR